MSGYTRLAEPEPRYPDRADSAAWIGEMLDELHTRELLDALLGAVCGGSWRRGCCAE